MSNILFIVAVIYILVNLSIWLLGKPTTWSWTRVFAETNGFLTAIILAAATPWILIIGLGITNFKVFFGVTVAVWFGTIFGLVEYLTNAKPLQR